MKTILFVCVHNAGRSQMAEGLLNALASERGLPIRGESAGTMATSDGTINPMAVEAMQEIGIDLTGHYPKQLTQEMAARADRVITMGCGVDADACPARFIVSEDWGLDDPKGQPIGKVREIRNEIARRVDALIAELSR